ncbi:hypothetical protein [Chryseobacterium scophthalmum]|uniref:hypothetical protein n=1 Tax=Chryseobacterium scophthalmum TaxID=59733 RepID=UPI001E3A214F|nr:hypothetical protein [Chryseobacterium scophthalmum]
MKSLKLILTVLLIGTSMFLNTLKAQQMATSNSQLNSKDRNIITISSFTAQGKLTELKDALNSGLDAGLTMNELKKCSFIPMHIVVFPEVSEVCRPLWKSLKNEKQKGSKIMKELKLRQL